MHEHAGRPNEQVTFEMLEPRLLLDAGTYGDNFLELSDGGYAYLADADVTDLDYSQDFSMEAVVHIAPYTPAGRWAGLLTKTYNYGLYSSAYAGWGLGTNQGHLEQLGQSVIAKVGDGTTQVSVSAKNATGQVYSVMTWDVSESTLTLYINGEEEGTSTNTAIVGTDIENAYNLQIGKCMQELGRDIFLARMWNREL